MDDLIPRTLRCRINKTVVEVCHGEIPDIFRQLYYDPVTEFELPPSRAPDGEFSIWLKLYRDAIENDHGDKSGSSPWGHKPLPITPQNLLDGKFVIPFCPDE